MLDGLRGTTPATQPCIPSNPTTGPRRDLRASTPQNTSHCLGADTGGLGGETKPAAQEGPQDQSRRPQELMLVPDLSLRHFDVTHGFFCILGQYFVCQKVPLLPFQGKKVTELEREEQHFW